MGMGFAPTWIRQVSPLLHKITLTTDYVTYVTILSRTGDPKCACQACYTFQLTNINILRWRHDDAESILTSNAFVADEITGTLVTDETRAAVTAFVDFVASVSPLYVQHRWHWRTAPTNNQLIRTVHTTRTTSVTNYSTSSDRRTTVSYSHRGSKRKLLWSAFYAVTYLIAYLTSVSGLLLVGQQDFSVIFDFLSNR